MSWLGRKLNSLLAHLRGNLWRGNVPTLWTDLETISADRPIFLMGKQGCGLTLLSRILQRHDRVVNVWGDSKHWAGSDELHVVMASRLPESLRLRGHPVLQTRGLGESWTYATDEMLPHFRKTGSDADEELRSHFLRIIRELLLLHVGRGKGYRFLDKSQTYTVKLAFLDELLQGTDPHYLLVTRNPYALCWRAVLQPLSEGNRAQLKRVRCATQHWENSYRCALEDGEQLDRMRVLRFEDFLADPGGQARTVCDFLGLVYEDDMLPGKGDRRPLGSSDDQKWYPVRSDVNRKYLDDLPSEVVDAVEERCGDLADRFGYTPEGP